ncbi:hypothetical protein FD06_GL000277 [Apilactobacillus ozensis DSM 23829 = JCM 17196]|uniref:DUF2577 domain-containing protein n=1 Tax=Apilactobacillus ozensis DSM 23829 = JCM 17196 TaxID=1423781 RepID=A0A0R2ASC7_9LACO|nr:DUF2577 domain-containing protein [Apilactobacillus ozensis]KRM69218.1 hypothetical protein FD06_GL000277 [Apilactobacillus ozensis DSM 23829 = JCM 17196]
MAGEYLLKQFNKRGGHASEYSDVVFGKVVSKSPLKIEVSNTLILTEDFLTLGRNVTDHKEKISIVKDSDKMIINKPEDKTKDIEIMVKQHLEEGDAVAMIRKDGGQEFYVFEKLGDD